LARGGRDFLRLGCMGVPGAPPAPSAKQKAPPGGGAFAKRSCLRPGAARPNSYLMWWPEIALEMTIRWISDVPSKMS
jgi:hypothetical protein